MSHSKSCIIQDTSFILNTLDTERSSCPRKIVLETDFLDDLFDEEGPVEIEDMRGKWAELDAVLSKLARTSISMRGERALSFILVALEPFDIEELVPAARMW